VAKSIHEAKPTVPTDGPTANAVRSTRLRVGAKVAVEDSKERENPSAKAGELKAFANQVSAQTGKAFTPNQAQVLLTLARTL
jgi:hypothetical protein